ncbi:yrdC domain-containing protein, mitochondrial [Rana temporaria]|uniref:yrdC domain-containing protein, mitochondrial n=1 Tax=Rana temporaria TaxID=8407 RepID=UPI001AAC936D|nr:yrdC domain-containing protein, mitochondrial [Rana temporaria]
MRLVGRLQCAVAGFVCHSPAKEMACKVVRLPAGARGSRSGPDKDVKSWKEILNTSAGLLQQGGVIGVPTDTIYGIACLAQSSQSMSNIYNLKGRNGTKPLAICVGDVEDIYRYCHVNVPEQLFRDLLPGPVTLVMERSDGLNKELNPYTSLVGVRIPDHAFIRQLAQICSEPLALTSANISTQESTLTVEEFKDLWPMLSLVVDGGPIGDLQSPECRLGSTVVDLSIPGKFTVIRPGCALSPTLEILKNRHGLIATS